VPRPRVAMRKIREVLRLTFGEGLSRRQVGASAGVPVTTVSDYVGRAIAAGVGWPLPESLDDAGLEALLYPPARPKGDPRPAPDWGYVHKELRRKSVTLQLLWLEYREAHPDGYGYSQFCNLYRSWRGGVDVVMRQSPGPGRSCSSISPATRSRSGTGGPGRFPCGPSCSSPSPARPATCSPRRSPRRSCCTG